jgi:hypothetical protein
MFWLEFFHVRNDNNKKVQMRAGSKKSLNVVPEVIFVITDLAKVCRLFEGNFYGL